MLHWLGTIVAIIMLVYGGYLIIFPKHGWNHFEGKSFKGREAKRPELASTIFTGIGFIIVALVILFKIHF
ncbi:hypothetical protein [Eremococcus coleocola]|uniref:hypothetical protein n=1 Tax=Eremococcus coleocola TaxID=88132 RepID=UPI0004042317|nr:hypothetical protein [Eremococcus coleocola]